MAKVDVHCPGCNTIEVVKFGISETGQQRYYCNNFSCDKITFMLAYKKKGYLPEIKQKIIDMAVNGSGVRDTARVLGISMNTVISELKKRA